MKYVGAHVSIAGGIKEAPLRAHAIGARAFALFVGNSNRWSSKAITEEEAEEFKRRCKEYGYNTEHILAHNNFLTNLGSLEEELLQKSRASFISELQRCDQLGIRMLNFHPGSHKNLATEEECLRTIAESINIALSSTENVIAVLETTAGQGTNMGHKFEHLAAIISDVEQKDRIGVCLDTCHSYSAGYDLATESGYEATWAEFDRIIGMQYLRGLHLNDDKRECGSRIDRHECLGKGTLGQSFFRRLMKDSRFDNLPMILETPEPEIWQEEIAWLYAQE